MCTNYILLSKLLKVIKITIIIIKHTCPFSFNMMLSEWRSPIPNTYVATQHPAQDKVKFSMALFKLNNIKFN